MKRRKKPKRKTGAVKAKAKHVSDSRHYPRAMIRWPAGLQAEPVIYPAGGSDADDEMIYQFLKKVLSRRNAKRA